MVPSWAVLPLVLLATAATIIASQALITGTYSLVLSAVQLGYLPRINVRHTFEHARGRIYIPLLNSLLVAGLYRARRHVQDLIESCSGLRGSGNDDDADYDDSFLLCCPLSLEVVRLQGSSALALFSE